MEKLKEAELAGELKIERPDSMPGILLGTSAFTAAGWKVLYIREARSRVRLFWQLWSQQN
jgi:hypothetical protein